MLRFSVSDRKGYSPPVLGGVLIGLIFLISFGAAGPWHLRMGFVALSLGIVMIAFPPTIRLPKLVIWMSVLLFVLGWASFLPLGITGAPDWRENLNGLGVDTGSKITIQSRLALEYHFSLILLGLIALWVLCLRFSIASTRNLALFLTFGVVIYAILAKLFEGESIVGQLGKSQFGFFPNRNHTGNLFAIAFVCGIGITFQSVRNKQVGRCLFSLILNGFIIWAILSWNQSRASVLFSLIGCVLWFGLLGWRYFGRQEFRAFGLLAALVAGVYMLSDFQVKERLEETAGKITVIEEIDTPDGERIENDIRDLDFRVPIAKDTLGLIKDYPLTGVGAGQFRWVFPQYREQTMSHRAVALHPESSWLWLAAEWGIPAMLCLLVLVGGCYYRGIKNIKRRGNRDRALRMGCLVASAIVPLHAISDVPAHRPALFLTALLLFVISQNYSPNELGPPKKSARLPGLAAGIALVLAGVFLFGNAWFGWEKPLVVRSEDQLKHGAALYEQIKEEESPLTPFKTLPLREELNDLANDAISEMPLDGRLHRLQALAILPLTYRKEELKAKFLIDQSLTPHSVRIPLIHASASLPYSDEEVIRGWREAIVRAKAVDQVGGPESREEERTIRSIRAMIHSVPRFTEWAAKELPTE